MTSPTVYPAYESWSIRKPAVRAAGGVVTSQHYLASRVGAGVLAATHAVDLGLELADRAVVLRRGRVVLDDPAAGAQAIRRTYARGAA